MAFQECTIHMQTNPEPTLPSPRCSIWLLPCRLTFSCHNRPKTRYHTIWDNPDTSEATEIIWTSPSKPAYPTSPIPSQGNHYKRSCQFSSYSCCLLTDSCASSCGMACLLILRTVVNESSFQ